MYNQWKWMNVNTGLFLSFGCEWMSQCMLRFFCWIIQWHCLCIVNQNKLLQKIVLIFIIVGVLNPGLNPKSSPKVFSNKNNYEIFVQNFGNKLNLVWNPTYCQVKRQNKVIFYYIYFIKFNRILLNCQILFIHKDRFLNMFQISMDS